MTVAILGPVIVMGFEVEVVPSAFSLQPVSTYCVPASPGIVNEETFA